MECESGQVLRYEFGWRDRRCSIFEPCFTELWGERAHCSFCLLGEVICLPFTSTQPCYSYPLFLKISFSVFVIPRPRSTFL